jgi:hypothetical protein
MCARRSHLLSTIKQAPIRGDLRLLNTCTTMVTGILLAVAP